MLTRLVVRNLKRFAEVDIELASPVVFVGPNNSGKTTALQALALWQVGVRKWVEKRGGRAAPEKRPGVTINRQDLISIPIPEANLLWRNLHVRDVETGAGSPRTSNVRIDILVEGVSEGAAWSCGLEFDYANPESFYCRPLREAADRDGGRMPVPPGAADARVAFLPPMSGLAAVETRLDLGAVNVRLGEGRTAEVLRNLCYLIVSGADGEQRWARLTARIRNLFGADLDRPRYRAERGEIEMTYREGRVTLDLSSAGRGLQQTLLLLAHMEVNPGAVLLLDEPDAHLEVLRQRQTYQLLSQVAHETGSQVVAASHSEVVLNEAAGRDMVIAFVGQPHRIDDRGSQELKSLRDIGFDQYALAEQTGWVLYLEGSTDYAVLQVFADQLGHRAVGPLQRPFVSYVQNQPKSAVAHFAGLREARRDLVGIAVFDRLERPLADVPEGLRVREWRRREIENYIAQRATLLRWAESEGEQREGGPLFATGWRNAMEQAIDEVEAALRSLGRLEPFDDLKVSDDYLTPIFVAFYRRLELPNLMNKSDYHQLARFVDVGDIDADIVEMLDAIADTADAANPRTE